MDNCIISNIPYVSVWDGGVEVETTCTIDLKTGNILDVKQVFVAGLEICEREYVRLNDEQVDVLEDDEGVRWVRIEGAQRANLALQKAEELDRTYVVTEWCSNCEYESEIHGWDTARDGFQAFCPHCGRPLMLCDECKHSPDYQGCDWIECHGCFRSRGDKARIPLPQDLGLRMGTPMGTLVAKRTTDPNYPGITVDLIRPDCEGECPICLVEYCSSENADTDLPEMRPELITRIWGDALNEEYTSRVVHGNIDRFFSEAKDR